MESKEVLVDLYDKRIPVRLKRNCGKTGMECCVIVRKVKQIMSGATI